MTIIDRALKLLEQYDLLAGLIIDVEEMCWPSAPSELEKLRKENSTHPRTYRTQMWR